MIVDTNAYLGPYAFRQLRHNTAAGLLRLMDEKGIITPLLQADLDRLTDASIPVDIVFNQGKAELGLE